MGDQDLDESIGFNRIFKDKRVRITRVQTEFK